MLKRFIFTLATLVLLILLCEGGIRLTEVDRRQWGDPYAEGFWWTRHFTPDPYLQWRGQPGWMLKGTEERLNARGYRGPDFGKPKKPGTRRIAVLGDSCSFGLIRVGEQDYLFLRNYAQVLQSILNEAYGPDGFEVFNYAHLGYTTFHGRRLLSREVLDDDPDFVIIRYGWNDVLSTQLGRSFSDPENPVFERIRDSLYRSRFLAMMLFKGAPQFSKNRIWESTPNPTPWVTEKDYARNLSRMIALSRGEGAEPLLLDAPAGRLTDEIRRMKGLLKVSGYDSFESFLVKHERYQQITAAVAGKENVRFVRTLAAPSEGGGTPYFNRYDFAHPNAAGHENTADHLFSEIASRAARPASP